MKRLFKLWVEEEMAINPGEYEAIRKGYPELAADLDRVCEARFKKGKQ